MQQTLELNIERAIGHSGLECPRSCGEFRSRMFQ
jgi:hypothetical protein